MLYSESLELTHLVELKLYAHCNCYSELQYNPSNSENIEGL